MRHLVQQHQTLIAELETMGAAAPVELASVANLLPPVAQDVIDRLSRHVATLRDAHRRPEDPAAAPVADPLKAAREWLRDAPPRANADNVYAFAYTVTVRNTVGEHIRCAERNAHDKRPCDSRRS
jgi:hypothetical protein